MADGRKKNGGARRGAGRKPKETSEELISLLDQAWPVEKRLQAIRKHATLAAKGNEKSFQILMNYAYGKPVDRKEITGEDGGAVEIRVVYGQRK